MCRVNKPLLSSGKLCKRLNVQDKTVYCVNAHIFGPKLEWQISVYTVKLLVLAFWLFSGPL